MSSFFCGYNNGIISDTAKIEFVNDHIYPIVLRTVDVATGLAFEGNVQVGGRFDVATGTPGSPLNLRISYVNREGKVCYTLFQGYMVDHVVKAKELCCVTKKVYKRIFGRNY